MGRSKRRSASGVASGVTSRSGSGGSLDSLRAQWESKTWGERVEFLLGKTFDGLVWVTRESFEVFVSGLSWLLGWQEAERGWEGGQPKPIVFRPAMEALVVFWMFFGFIGVLSAWGAVGAIREGDEIETYIYTSFVLCSILGATWESFHRLRIRLDARFVYETFLYSIVFFPTDVRISRNGDWVIVFNPRAVDPQGLPSVDFWPKRWWIGKLALAARKEFGEASITFSHSVWNLDRGSYMSEVLDALRQAVKEGKQVQLW